MKNNKIAKTIACAVMAAAMTVGGATGSFPYSITNSTSLVAEATWSSTAYATGDFYKSTNWTNWISVKPSNSRNSCSVKVAAFQQNGRCNNGKFEVQIWSSDGRYVDYKYVDGSKTIQLNYGYSGYNLRIRRRTDDGINTSRTIHWSVTETGGYNVTTIGTAWNRNW